MRLKVQIKISALNFYNWLDWKRLWDTGGFRMICSGKRVLLNQVWLGVISPTAPLLRRARGEHRCGTSLTRGKARTPSTTRTRRWWRSSWARCSSCCSPREPTTRWQTQRTSGTCFTRSWTISMKFTYSSPPPTPAPPQPPCILDTRMDCLVRVMDSSFFSPPSVLWQCLSAGH